MSSIATSLSAQSAPRPFNWTRLSILGPATPLVAVLANALVYFMGSAVVAYDSEFLPLATVGGTVVMTVAPAIAAVLVYAVLRRLTRHAVLIFTALSVVVFAVSLLPVFTYIPTVPGWTPTQSAMLVVLHIVAASVIVRLLTLSHR